MKRGKVFALTIISLLLTSFLVGVVAAADNPFNTIFVTINEKWLNGEGLTALEAKVTLALIIAVIISIILISLGLHALLSIILSLLVSFLFTAYITPDALTGIFTSYDIFPMTIAIILPLSVFFGFSAIAAYNGNRVLITAQLVLWGIALILYSGQLIIQLIGIGGGLISANSLTALQMQYWWIMIIIGTIVSILMTFANGFFMNFAVRWFYGVKDITNKAAINQMKTGMKTLREIGKATS